MTASVDKECSNFHRGHLLSTGIFIAVLDSSKEKLSSLKSNCTILDM